MKAASSPVLEGCSFLCYDRIERLAFDIAEIYLCNAAAVEADQGAVTVIVAD